MAASRMALFPVIVKQTSAQQNRSVWPLALAVPLSCIMRGSPLIPLVIVDAIIIQWFGNKYVLLAAYTCGGG